MQFHRVGESNRDGENNREGEINWEGENNWEGEAPAELLPPWFGRSLTLPCNENAMVRQEPHPPLH